MGTLIINQQSVDFIPGESVLQAAKRAGIIIPTLCYHPDLSIDGSCRLCLVEVEGLSGEHAACALTAQQEMCVHTETSAIVASRKSLLEMLLAGYVPANDPIVDQDNELLTWAKHYNVSIPSDNSPRRYEVDSDPNPFIKVDLNQCILCTRCVRACEEIQGRFVWAVGYRGANAKLIAGLDTTMLDARCESCGQCVAYCPTGALTDRGAIGASPVNDVVTTTCPYCGVGCRFDLNIKDDRIVRVTSNAEAPVNGLSLCVKGRYGFDFVHHEDRLTSPRVRQYLLDQKPKPSTLEDRGDWVDVSWDFAIDLVASRLSEVVRESGPQAIGMLSSAKCTNEENYLMQKFARQVVGTHNIDHCARLCHSSTVAGLAAALGSGAMSNSMDDIANFAKSIFVIGSNTTEQHPVFGTMLRQAVMRRQAKLIVADPRKIDLTEFATLHLRQKPGTDIALMNGLAHLIIADHQQNMEFIASRCEGYDRFAETVAKYPPERTSEITGVSIADLRQCAALLAEHRPGAVVWAMGITQHTCGVWNVLGLANLQMLLGNFGVPGSGVNPLRGQNNVQGACDLGALPNVFPGYQSVKDQAAAEKFDRAWACDGRLGNGFANLSAGLTVTEMITAAGRGDVRALYILGEDPAMSEPDSNHAKQSLAACGFVVLQEILQSETSVFADVLLPGASFAEKSGTFTNTERRVQLISKAIPPPGIARPDWQVTSDLANATLSKLGRVPSGEYATWSYTAAEMIMKEIAALTPSYAGVSHARLVKGERLQWPVPDLEHPGTPILHVKNFPRGKGLFHAVEHVPADELPDEEYPFLLTTGRVLYHWHGGELTRRVPGLSAVYPQTLVEVHPNDGLAIGLLDGDQIELKSRRGEMLAHVILSDRVAPGVIFGNFHFPGIANVNNLTNPAVDPIAKIPEYKVCAVSMRPAK